MAWRVGSCASLGRNIGRQTQFGPSSMNYVKPALCSQTLINWQNGGTQVRHKSGFAFPDLKEYVSPPEVSATIFSDWAPVTFTQELLYQLHDLAGIGWVPTIALSTLGLQLLVGFPVRVLQQQSMARLENLMPQLQKLHKDILLETAIAKKTYNWTDKQCSRTVKNAVDKHFKNLYKEHNCHPLRSLGLGLVQAVPWVTFSMALRNIAFMLPDNVPEIASDQQYRYMQLAVENLPWLDSLVAPDPFILPGIFVLASLINIQLAIPTPKADVPVKTRQKVLPWVLRTAVVGVGVFGTFLPSAVTLYWAVSSTSAVAVNVLLKLPFVRSAVGIPKTPSTQPLKMPSLKPKSKWFKFPPFKPKNSAV